MESNLRSPEDFTEAEYARELKSWCRNRKDAAKSRPASIAIVGAGMAGLVTAWLLREAGHDVTVFEASPAAGGRVKTIRFGKGGPYAEAGAMRVPRSHCLTTWLTEAPKLRAIRIAATTDRSWSSSWRGLDRQGSGRSVSIG